jgi:lipoprotein NlpD
VTLALAVATLAGCSYPKFEPAGSTPRTPAPQPAKRPGAYIVKRGDTLYSIAWRYGFDYRQLAGWNAIREPYTIFPGQKLRLTKPPKTASPSKKSASTRRPTTASKSAATASKRKKSTSSGSLKKSSKAAAKGGSAAVKRWYWPAKGKVVTSFSRSGGKGIDIAGRFGQPIQAAADGKVVYSGSGLIGYGQLIIVKHNKRYLSAYAHNNKILVKEGDTVKGGQRIAEMGRSGSNRAMLHFEIRRDGKPTNPVRYLPK